MRKRNVVVREDIGDLLGLGSANHGLLLLNLGLVEVVLSGSGDVVVVLKIELQDKLTFFWSSSSSLSGMGLRAPPRATSFLN